MLQEYRDLLSNPVLVCRRRRLLRFDVERGTDDTGVDVGVVFSSFPPEPERCCGPMLNRVSLVPLVLGSRLFVAVGAVLAGQPEEP